MKILMQIVKTFCIKIHVMKKIFANKIIAKQMKLNLILILIASLIATLQISCKKLPNETDRGRGILACYVNGEKYVARGILCKGSDLICFGSEKDGVRISIDGDTILTIEARDKKNNSDIIEIHIHNFKGIGDYVLSCNPGGAFNSCMSNAVYSSFSTDSSYTGILYVKTYDKKKNFTEDTKIIAGTFEFEAYDSKKNEVIKITEGRFDIGY